MYRIGGISILCAALICAAGIGAAVAGQHDFALPQGFTAVSVLKTGMTSGGTQIAYPNSGTPEIVSVVATLEPGGRTARHQHPVPVYVYVLEGAISVKADGGESHLFKAGQAWLEHVNHTHQAFNEGSTPVRILVVFMGSAGAPTTIAVN